MTRRLEHVPVQDPWAQLGLLCGVDLTGAVACEYPDESCQEPAVWVAVQEHKRPPIPCDRTNLCTGHRLAVEMAETREIADGCERMVCTHHLRDVSLRARWERL